MQTTIEDALREEGFLSVAGLDEVGRGPLAGPVCAAAVILPPNSEWEGLNDSKKLSAKKRDLLFEQIKSGAIAYAVGLIEPEKIDEVNILNASFLAMKQAMEQLSVTPDHLLIDGNQCRFLPEPYTCIIKGDSKVASIAAASIIAKVTRDRLMDEYDAIYPQYGFKKHKGYPTKEHIEAVRTYGPCPIHRRSFLKKILEVSNEAK
ncbi:MAG: ribonuclease HII [Clostridia bacterium]|nr:ribonuclease HII [Clostridia bacterium]